MRPHNDKRVEPAEKSAEAGSLRALLGAIVESSDDAIIGKDLNGIITSWNHGAEKIFGYTAGEMVGTSILRLIPADRQKEEIQILDQIASGKSVSHFETVRQTKDGRLLDVSVTISPVKDAKGKIIGVSKVARDITPRKAQEREILRLSRLYVTLSQINQAIVWTSQRGEMLEKVCRALVENGGFRMAWIGQPDAVTRRVNPVAKWGDSTDYLSHAVIYADDRPEGYGPVGTAIREEKKYVCNDIVRDPNMLPWLEAANRADFRAVASFPIRQGGAVCGALTIYSDEIGFFQDKEIALLEEAATDVSFALDNLAREEVRRQAEEAVHRSREEFKDLFENAPVGFHEIDTEGRIIRINNTELKMLGYTAGELLGQFVWKISADEETSRQAALAKLRGELLPPDGFERIFRRKDGSTFPVMIEDRLLKREDGAVTGIRAAIQDITERKQAEAELNRERDLLRTLMDNSPDSIYFKDAQSRFVKASKAQARQCGVASPEEMAGKTDFDFFDESHARPAFEDEQEIIRTGRPIIAKEECEVWKDGPVTWASTTKLPWLDAAGKIIGTIGISRDITERKRAEQALRLAGVYNRSLIEASLDPLVTIGTDGKITDVNAATEKATGCARAELIGTDFSDYFTEPEKARAGFQRAFHDGFVRDYPLELRHRDRHIMSVLYNASVYRDAAGEVIGVFAAARDITERRELENQLRQSQKMEAFGQLAGGVAHDFNNILAVIQLQAGLLKMEHGLSPEQLAFASDIELAAQRGANLTRQLLLFSRKQTMQLQNLKFKDVVDNVASMLRRTLGEHIELQLKFAQEPLFIRADPSMMDQILLNLAVNARDAMPKGGQIIIETSAAEFDEVTAAQYPQARPGSFVCLSVSDTGNGIPPEILPRIFEPFFTTKEVGKGTGLGLATVFGIVEQHQGWITVYSEVGRGTAFRVYLPRQNKASDTEFFWSSRSSLRGGKETILLVEDEAPLRAIVRTALSRLGYQVLEAANGTAALALWQQHRDEINLLLTDLVMPGEMTGKELAGQLLRQNPKLKVIYASGYSVEVAGKDLLLEEGVNFLAKPFQTPKLAQTIRRRLDQD